MGEVDIDVEEYQGVGNVCERIIKNGHRTFYFGGRFFERKRREQWLNVRQGKESEHKRLMVLSTAAVRPRLTRWSAYTGDNTGNTFYLSLDKHFIFGRKSFRHIKSTLPTIEAECCKESDFRGDTNQTGERSMATLGRAWDQLLEGRDCQT